jgi:hypothetical protein
MPIAFQCLCGAPLKAKEESAGKKTKCPQCGKVIDIPGGATKVTAAVVASGPVASADPFAPDLDWSSLSGTHAAASAVASGPADPSRPTSGAITIDSIAPTADGTDPPRLADPSIRQYKVLSQKEQGFTGKFNPVKLEEALNQWAHRGWSVKTASSIKVQGHGGDHEELIVILER